MTSRLGPPRQAVIDVLDLVQLAIDAASAVALSAIATLQPRTSAIGRNDGTTEEADS